MEEKVKNQIQTVGEREKKKKRGDLTPLTKDFDIIVQW